MYYEVNKIEHQELLPDGIGSRPRDQYSLGGFITSKDVGHQEVSLKEASWFRDGLNLAS